MLGFLSTAAASHRILTSRVFALAFLLTVLLTESAQEGSPLADVLFLGGIVLVGVATVGRLWCSLYISGYKCAEPISTGPYSMCRHPLYFFSFLGFIGVGLATETLTLALFMVCFFLLCYPVVIAREESELSLRFGDTYRTYSACTPKFFPHFSKFKEPAAYLVNPILFRRTMGDVVWFVWLVGVIEVVEALHNHRVIEPLLSIP